MSSTETSTATAVIDPPSEPDTTLTDRDDHLDGPVRGDTADSGGPDTAGPGSPRVQAMMVPPGDLVIADNVRKTFDLSLPEFADMRESIAQFGVDVPVLVERHPDGGLHVVAGQLRTLLATEVGTEEIPVWVTDADATVPENERRIRTALMQLRENHRRVEMTRGDDAAAVALMLDLGASATRVAKGLQRKRSQVQKQAAVGSSPTATRLLDSSRLSLDQLAVIAEYERLGDQEAVEDLESAGSAYSFGLREKAIARTRREDRARLHASLPYAALGFGVLTREPELGDADRFVPWDEVVTEAGEPVNEDAVRAEAARWAVWVEVDEDADLVHRETGALVDPDTVDWDADTDSDSPASDGLLPADAVEWRDRWTPSYYLLAEHLPGSGLRRRTGIGDGDVSTSEDARAEAAEAAVRRERERLERRRVRELNKLGVDANERRVEFLVRFLRGRTPPARAAAFVAESLAHRLDMRQLQLVTTLLGVGGSREKLLEAIASASVNRAWMIVLAMELAVHEDPIDKSLWRTPDRAQVRYLTFVAEVGAQVDGEDEDKYFPAEVERAGAGLIDYHDIELDSAA
ncbi:ParB/RepB/Spo0J family partition protein [Nocardia sp. NPDC003482]